MAKQFVWSPYFTDTYDPLQAGSIDGTDEIPHDRAINRAFTATYKSNNSVVGDPKCTLFIGKLNTSTTEKTLFREFSRHGDVHRVRVVRDIVTGISKKYAFVEFVDVNYARRAWEYMHNATIDDQNILVEFEFERTMKGWIPRRLGGGLSGQKESGQLRFGGRDKPFRKPIFIGDNEKSLISNLRDQRDFRNDRDWNRSRDSDRDSGRNSQLCDRRWDEGKARRRSRSPGRQFSIRDRRNNDKQLMGRERRSRSRERRSKSKERSSRNKGRRSRSRERRSRSRERRSRSRERRSKSKERSLRNRDSTSSKEEPYQRRKGRF